MKAFGFLSFGHYAFGGQRGPSAEEVAKIHLEIAQAADEIGVNNASFRVHHFVPQASAPMPLLGAVAATTKNIEVGTGVIDMRYENPLYLAEEAASLYQISGGRGPWASRAAPRRLPSVVGRLSATRARPPTARTWHELTSRRSWLRWTATGLPPPHL